MADRILLVMAKRAGRYIAGAINFIGSDTLFGRHWGAIEHHPFLHFELCYYQAIDFAIARKLARVEAGAQGEHKLARGYLPITTYSAHYIADPALRRAIADYLVRERAYVEAAGRELGEWRRSARTSPPRTYERRAFDAAARPCPCRLSRTDRRRFRPADGGARCRATIRTTSSQKSCAASCPRTRSTRTTAPSRSSTSCRARPATRW